MQHGNIRTPRCSWERIRNWANLSIQYDQPRRSLACENIVTSDTREEHLIHYIVQTAIEVAWLGDLKYVSRFAITTSSGSYQVWQQDRNQWVREESLSAIEAATFVDLPQPLTTVDRPTPHGFRKRLQNQLVELWVSTALESS